MKTIGLSRGRFILAAVVFVSAILFLVIGWQTGHLPFHHKEVTSDIAYWTCPMHPQIHADGPGQCPICHMDLVPVRKTQPPQPSTEKDGVDASAASGEKTAPGVDVPLERQQLIGLRTAVVEEKELNARIRTTGRVAFDPELAVAIREYLTIAGSDPGLRQYAVTRLKMLGMGDEEIRMLPARRRDYESLYLQQGDTTWVYAALYQNDLPFVKPGMKARIRLPAGGAGTEWEGTVRSISPTVDPRTRNLQARIEVKHSKDLRPDMYVNVSILSHAGRGLVVPRDAVIDTGNEQLVYVVRDKTHFFPVHVRLGAEVDEGIAILAGLKAGDVVVSSATFLIDSESRLRGGM